MFTKAEKVKAVTELRQKYDLKQLLVIAGMARSTYYYTLKATERDEKYHEQKKLIKTIFDENKARYGYRRITMELKNRGVNINHKQY